MPRTLVLLAAVLINSFFEFYSLCEFLVVRHYAVRFGNFLLDIKMPTTLVQEFWFKNFSLRTSVLLYEEDL